MSMEPPGYYAELAVDAERKGDWLKAAELWRTARTASMGHNRRQRYEDAAERCEQTYYEVQDATNHDC